VGAGVFGLLTVWRQSERLLFAAENVDEHIVVLDNPKKAACAPSIVCGVVRRNYFQVPKRCLMARSVNIRKSHPEGLSAHPIIYVKISSESMRDVTVTPSSAGAASLRDAKRSILTFEPYAQRFDFDGKIWRLARTIACSRPQWRATRCSTVLSTWTPKCLASSPSGECLTSRGTLTTTWFKKSTTRIASVSIRGTSLN